MPSNTPNTAMLNNVSLCKEAMERAIKRAPHLPGLVVFYGPSGWGKSFAAAACSRAHHAYYVEAKSSWTPRALLLAILDEMGVGALQNRYEMTDQVSAQLLNSRRPLIIDEVDYLVRRREVEVIRDIYEGSRAPILLIGEERLPVRLKSWERFHSRVLDWVPAQPAVLQDARDLAEVYVPQTAIADDLLANLVEIAHGSVRRICVNLERIRAFCMEQNLPEIDIAKWGDQELFSGDPPVRSV